MLDDAYITQLQEHVATLQRQVTMLLEANTQLASMQGGVSSNQVTAIVPTKPFMSDTDYSSGLRTVDEDRVQDLMLDGPPAPRLLKRPPDGCTPDYWDSFGRLMQYEPLPEQSQEAPL